MDSQDFSHRSLKLLLALVAILLVAFAVVYGPKYYRSYKAGKEAFALVEQKIKKAPEMTSLYKDILLSNSLIIFPEIKSQTVATPESITSSMAKTFSHISAILKEGAKIGSANKITYMDGSSGYQVSFNDTGFPMYTISEYRNLLVLDKAEILQIRTSEYTYLLEAKSVNTKIQILMERPADLTSIIIKTITLPTK